MEPVVDAKGRRIARRTVGVLETLRLYKALGPELSINMAYVDLAKTALQASSVDEIPLPYPTNEAGVEAIIERLGEAGIDALVSADTAEDAATLMADVGN